MKKVISSKPSNNRSKKVYTNLTDPVKPVINLVKPKEIQVLKEELSQNLDVIKEKTAFFAEFIDFIKKYGVVGLALGVVIGSAVKSLVDSLVLDIINPLLGKILGRVDLNNLMIWDIAVGRFLNQLINFILLLFVVYISIKLFIGRFLSEEEKKNLKIPESIPTSKLV